MNNCIECGAGVSLKNPTQGEIVECSDCGVELEVRAVSPIRLEAAPREQEDWGE
jgi:alpha-aminoadipate/glutamate carrier protein LysW